MSVLQPISVALIGFNESEERAMGTLFANSERWQVPWRMVAVDESPQILILAADSFGDLSEWQQWSAEPHPSRLIVYSEHAPEGAFWHLTRPKGGGNPSRVEFTALLKRVSLHIGSGPLCRADDTPGFQESADIGIGAKNESPALPLGNADGHRFRRFLRFLFRSDK